jgi:NAD(P)H-hydrate epimerase
MWYSQKQDASMLKQIQPEDIVVFGPGLGEDAWAKFVWRMMCSIDNRMVVDASALKFLAQQPSTRPRWILTPHPGEAAILLNTNVAKIQADRFSAIQQLKNLYGAICILKGSGTLVIDDKSHIQVCPQGNPGMASPGMGDVLAGLVAGAWAQGLEPSQAAINAVSLHALCGDAVAQQALNHVALASQVIDYIQKGKTNHD